MRPEVWAPGRQSSWVGLWEAWAWAAWSISYIRPKRILLSIFYASLACACLLGWGVDLLGFVPFPLFAGWILAHNLLVGLLLVPPLVITLHPRVASRFMLFSDLLDKDQEISARRRQIGAVLLSVSLVCFCVFGMHFGTSAFEMLFNSDSSYLRGAGFSPFVALIFLGIFLL